MSPRSLFVLTRPDGFARAHVERIGEDRYRVVGHVAGEPIGEDGLGREFPGPGARQRARRFAVAAVYGGVVPEIGAQSGDTLIGLQPVIVWRAA